MLTYKQHNGFIMYSISFGVIVAFATNTYVNSGLTGATNAARVATVDSQTYISNTGEQLDHILVNNYRELSIQLKKILEGSLFEYF